MPKEQRVTRSHEDAEHDYQRAQYVEGREGLGEEEKRHHDGHHLLFVLVWGKKSNDSTMVTT
jgi:hypothetical protein